MCTLVVALLLQHPRKSTAFMAPLISFQQPLVSTQWVEPCVQPLKNCHRSLLSLRISSRLFSFLSLSCKNASFADKQKAEGPSQSLLYLLRALTGVPHCRKMFFTIFSPKFLKSKKMLKHSTKTKQQVSQTAILDALNKKTCRCMCGGGGFNAAGIVARFPSL